MAKRSFARAARRLTAWEAGPGELSTPVEVITASGAELFDTGQTPLTSGLTIVRIRGFAELILTSAATVGDGFTGSLGIGICTATAFASGVAAVPMPTTEIADENWLWMQEFGLHAQTVGVDGPLASYSFEIDSKAMRKFDDGMVVYAAWEMERSPANATLQISFRTRMLLKLS